MDHMEQEQTFEPLSIDFSIPKSVKAITIRFLGEKRDPEPISGFPKSVCLDHGERYEDDWLQGSVV